MLGLFRKPEPLSIDRQLQRQAVHAEQVGNYQAAADLWAQAAQVTDQPCRRTAWEHAALKCRNRQWQARAGFTLVELLVVIGIMAILMAMGVPLVKSMSRSARESSGINTIGVAATATRAYAGRAKKFVIELSPANFPGQTGSYSGVAMVFTPSGEIRIVENIGVGVDPNGADPNGTYLEMVYPGLNGYDDLAGREYIMLPKDTGVVGLVRNANGLMLLTPPFAVRFNEAGLLIPGGDYNDHINAVYYNGDYSQDAQNRPTFDINTTRANPRIGGTYDPQRWADPSVPGSLVTPDANTGRLTLPFERLEAVIGLMVFSKGDLRAAGWSMASDPTTFEINSDAKKWILDPAHHKPIFFSRYTGTVMREINP